MKAVLWMPGRFNLTNKMLSNLRAAGVARGRGIRGAVDYFAEETLAIRLAAASAARQYDLARLVPVPDTTCDVGVYVFGHRKHDPDAWYLLAKPAIDGLVNAGVFYSDRRQVHVVSGRVLQTHFEEEAARTELGLGKLPLSSSHGAAIVLHWLGMEVCGHA
jgi:hypothetical protein